MIACFTPSLARMHATSSSGVCDAAIGACVAESDVAYVSDGGISYSDVGPQTVAGTGNINMDPLFVDPASASYPLRPGSPAQDAADPGATLSVDIDGDTRPQRGRSDMGVDEVVE